MAKKAPTTPAKDGSGAEASAKPYTVLARRYRSRDFGEVVGQGPIARTLQNAIQTGRTAHAYLFCGTRGVGKTSMARIFARALNRDSALAEGDAIGDAILRGEDLDVIEIDGASNRGIDDARDLIAGAGLAPTRGKYRIYIIDEVHMLTTPAFNALLKTMEEPPAHVKFILCTTEPHKVPQTIQSRCQRFDFRNIPTKEIAAHLGHVAQGEGVDVTEEVLLNVARMANGSMRDGLSLLDRLLAAATGRVDATVLEQVFGLPDDEILLDILAACVGENPADALRHGARLLERGSGVEQALELLAERFRWVLVATAAGAESDLLEVAASMRDRVSDIARATDTAFAAHAIALCDATSRNARGSSTPRALYDACLARLALSKRFAAGAALLAGAGGGANDPKKAGDPAARGVPGTSVGTVHAPSAASQARASGVGPSGAPPQSGSAPRSAVSSPAMNQPASSAASSAASSVASSASRTGAGSGATAASSAVAGGSATVSDAWSASPAAAQASRASEPEAAAVASLDALRRRLEELASRSPKDRALVEQFDLVEFTAATGSARIEIDGAHSGGRYLASNPEPIRALVARAAGRPLRLAIEVREPSQRADPTEPRISVDDPSVRGDPLVRRAAELFDATILAVTPRIAVDEAGAGDDDLGERSSGGKDSGAAQAIGADEPFERE